MMARGGGVSRTGENNYFYLYKRKYQNLS